MQNWKNYFLNQAKQFGVCAHQKDLDTDKERYYPFKEKLFIDIFQKRILDKTQQLNKIKADYNCLRQQYEIDKKKFEDDFYEHQNYLKKLITETKKSYQKISELKCEDKSINNIIKLSCLSKLKQQIYYLESSFSENKPCEFFDYGNYIKQIVQNLEKDINSYKKIIDETKKRVENQNHQIDEIYRILDLNADDFDMKKFDLN